MGDETEAWSHAYQRGDAEAKGRAAGLRGDPLLAPAYDRESLRAAWRIGWRKGNAQAGRPDEARRPPMPDPAIPHDAKPAGEVELIALLLAVRQWANAQSAENAAALYSAALRYWGVRPVVSDA